MKHFDLQLFAEPVQGSKIIYLYRILAENATQDGTKIAYVTENSMSIDKSADSTPTKDGAIRTPGVAEVEVESTSVFQKGDELIDRLKQAMLNGKLLEIWRANLDAPTDVTYTLTTDTALVAGKTYYTRSGTSPNYTYTAVASPAVADIASYYELTSANKFKGTYYQGYLTSFEESATAEDFVEYSLTFGINGNGVDGSVTVPAAQQEEASYGFADTPKTGA